MLEQRDGMLSYVVESIVPVGHSCIPAKNATLVHVFVLWCHIQVMMVLSPCKPFSATNTIIYRN
jgi:hypothetical protein